MSHLSMISASPHVRSSQSHLGSGVLAPGLRWAREWTVNVFKISKRLWWKMLRCVIFVQILVTFGHSRRAQQKDKSEHEQYCFSNVSLLPRFFPQAPRMSKCHQNLHEHHLPTHLSPQYFLIYFNCFDNLNTFTIHSGSSEPEANTLLSHLLINFLRESTISYVTLVAVGRIIY